MADKSKECRDFTNKAGFVEVKHGAWKAGKLGGCHGWYCSVCGSGYQGVNAEWISKTYDYCGKCGAKMDGEEEEAALKERNKGV